MKKFIIRKAKSKGKGIFAKADIKKGELIMVRNYASLKKYQANDKRLQKSDHVDYIGHGKYVIDNSPSSYLNHSCNPNTKTLPITRYKAKNYALRNIKKDEELTHNYSKTRKELEQAKKERLYIWEMKCMCGSKNCKKIVRGF